MEPLDIHAKICALHSTTVLPIKFHLIFAKGVLLQISNEILRFLAQLLHNLRGKRPCEAMNTPNHSAVIRARSVCEQGRRQIPSGSMRAIRAKKCAMKPHGTFERTPPVRGITAPRSAARPCAHRRRQPGCPSRPQARRHPRPRRTSTLSGNSPRNGSPCFSLLRARRLRRRYAPHGRIWGR
jgi:hypothetical protein